MRDAFCVAGLFALSLTLTLTLIVPAYALEDDGTPSSRKAVKSVHQATTAQAAASWPAAADGEKQSESGPVVPPVHDGWVKVESGARPVYVGIHGGTAPLSLMRSTDGVLFAFTGQTGNDFTQVLRGGNASRADMHPGQNGATAQPPAKDSVVAKGELSRSASAGATVQPSGAATAARSSADKGPESAKSAGLVTKTLPSDKEASSPSSVNLVFASGEMTAEGYQPFGLTPPAGGVLSPEAMRATPGALIGKPLKLRSYKQILNYTGSV